MVGITKIDAVSLFAFCKSETESISNAIRRELTTTGRSTRITNKSVELAITKGYIYHYDVLEFIISHVKPHLDAAEVFHQMISCCEETMERFENISDYELEYIGHALDTYIPSDYGKGEPEKILLDALQSVGDMNVPTINPKSGYTHPMRCIPLGNALQISLWRTRPCFFGARPIHTAYHLSQNCERCD